MKDTEFKRILLKDSFGDYYRICGAANTKDSKGEWYIKLVFPGIRNIPMIIAENDDSFNIVKENLILNGIQEFSYHYQVGLAHYKSAPRAFVDQEKSLPTLNDSPALHLIRYIIHTPLTFEMRDKTEIAKDDFVIPHEFNGRARSLEIFISKDFDVCAFSSQTARHIDLYRVNLRDPKIALFISDGFWMRRPISITSPLELFRYADPTFIFKSNHAQRFIRKN
jgi:hypothetical protein